MKAQQLIDEVVNGKDAIDVLNEGNSHEFVYKASSVLPTLKDIGGMSNVELLSHDAYGATILLSIDNGVKTPLEFNRIKKSIFKVFSEGGLKYYNDYETPKPVYKEEYSSEKHKNVKVVNGYIGKFQFTVYQ